MSSLTNEDCIYTVRSMYLGSEPMGELLEGENGSDVIQVPLKRTILRTNSIGKEVDLSITNDSLVINSVKSEKSGPTKLPIELLAYCGALRQLPQSQIVSREFETLDKSPAFDDNSIKSPPIFVTIFRCLENENTLYCHSFVIRRDEEAMELVKLVMEIYYNFVRMNQSMDSNDENDPFNKSAESNDLNFNDLKGNSKVEQINSDKLNELLKMYNNQTTGDSKEKSVVSAKDIIKEALNSSEYKLQKFGDVPLNEDDNPIVIKKENNEEIVYKQNVFIRWLQPPTPPPPAPIIIREVQDPAPESLPPLVIYKQAPRPPTPPPLIIRERPPTPIEVPKEPLIIERRVPVQERHRKVIIEHLPAPPPKPRDIILEKWIPREPAPRSVYVQKSTQICYQKPVYEVIEQKNTSPKTNHRPRKEIEPAPKDTKKPKSLSRRPNSNESLYQSDPLYSSKTSKQAKVAGYRIIRQIIPGPSSTPSDIEKAIARSQRVSCTVYSNHNQMYSPCYENIKHHQSHYQAPRHVHNRHPCGSKFVTNIGQPNVYSPGSGCYSVINYNPHPKVKQVVVQQSYAPHNNVFNKIDRGNNLVRREVYRSTSFDRF